MSTIPLTRRGSEKLKEELQRLKTVERHAVIQAIAEARAQGDLSENAEYEAAKDKQGFIEGRILEIEGKLAAAQVIDPATLDADGRVVFGSTVELEDEVQRHARHLPDRRRRRGRPEAGADLDQQPDRACADRPLCRRRGRGARAGRPEELRGHRGALPLMALRWRRIAARRVGGRAAVHRVRGRAGRLCRACPAPRRAGSCRASSFRRPGSACALAAALADARARGCRCRPRRRQPTGNSQRQPAVGHGRCAPCWVTSPCSR